MQGQIQHQAQVFKEAQGRLQDLSHALALQSGELDSHKSDMNDLEILFRDELQTMSQEVYAAMAKLQAEVRQITPEMAGSAHGQGRSAILVGVTVTGSQADTSKFGMWRALLSWTRPQMLMAFGFGTILQASLGDCLHDHKCSMKRDRSIVSDVD